MDGYIESNDQLLVHLNMGWGGRNDGWYDPFCKIIGLLDDIQNRLLISIMPNK
ncbi:MAG: C10 family peptidase [Ignavibacteriae bacterium]|nr:C10 family peptidase [Ignavibacteriota bacterium]